MKTASNRLIEIMYSIGCDKWIKAYNDYPNLSELLMVLDDEKTCNVELEKKLKHVLWATEAKLKFADVKIVAILNLGGHEIREVIRFFEDEIPWDVFKKYASGNLTFRQMAQIRHAILDGLTLDQIATFAHPNVDVNSMRELRILMKQGLSSEKAAILAMSANSTAGIKHFAEQMSMYSKIENEYWQLICKMNPDYYTTALIIEEVNKGLSIKLLEALVESDYDVCTLKEILGVYNKLTEEQTEYLFNLGKDYNLYRNSVEDSCNELVQEVIKAFKAGTSVEIVKNCMDKAIKTNSAQLSSLLYEEIKRIELEKLRNLVNKKPE